MKKYILYFIKLAILSIVLYSCEPEKNMPHVIKPDVPLQVSDIKVENLPGAAKITYRLPNDSNILYILATYNLSDGKEVQTKSSLYKNFVEVEGFSKAGEYVVNLYSVSRSEIKSEPILVKVHPTDALVHEVFPTLKTLATFGGVNVKFENSAGGEYVLHTLVKDSLGSWVEYDRLYTQALAEQSYTIRGLKDVLTDFKFYFTDKWQNSSDTLSVSLTPLFEEEFDKSLWKDAALADDFNIPRYGPLSELWTPGERTYFFMSHTAPGLQLPNWFTIDLGRKYIFGRLKVDMVRHADSWMYSQGTPEIFEIWASNTKTTDWDMWTMLGRFTCIKPSGAPLGTITQADRDHVKLGDNYDFEPNENSYRYFRFKTIKTFANTPDVRLLELTLYGKAVD